MGKKTSRSSVGSRTPVRVGSGDHRTMMIDGASEPALQRAPSQYYTGALDSDDDGISVVEGTFVDSDATLKVNKDGIPVISSAPGMASGTYWQSFSGYLGVSTSSRQQRSVGGSQSRRWGLLPLSSKSDDTSSVSTTDDEGDPSSASTHLVSRMESLQSLWAARQSNVRRSVKFESTPCQQFERAQSEKLERVPSPGLSPMGRTADATDESDDDFSLSGTESIDGSLSSSAAAPSLSAEDDYYDDDTLYTASNHEAYGQDPLGIRRGNSSFIQETPSVSSYVAPPPSNTVSPSPSNFVSISRDGLATKEEVDVAMNKWLRSNILGERVELPGRATKPIQSLDTEVTDKLSTGSLIIDDSSTSGSSPSELTSTTTSTNGENSKKSYGTGHARSPCSCFRWVCMIVLLVSLITVIGIGLGMEVWRRESEDSAIPMTLDDPGVAVAPSPSPRPSTPFPMAASNEGDSIPLFLRLSFRDPVSDLNSVAGILETQLDLMLSTIDGLLFVEIWPKDSPGNNIRRNLRISHAVFVGNAIFGVKIDYEVVSVVSSKICELLNDVDKVEGVLSKDPTLNGIEYTGPGWGQCSHNMSNNPPPPTMAPSLEPTRTEVAGRGMTTPMPTPIHNAPRPARPPSSGLTIGDQKNDSGFSNLSARAHRRPPSEPGTD